MAAVQRTMGSESTCSKLTPLNHSTLPQGQGNIRVGRGAIQLRKRSVNPTPLGWTHPDQGPALVEPMDEKGTFSFPSRRNQSKLLGLNTLRTNNR